MEVRPIAHAIFETKRSGFIQDQGLDKSHRMLVLKNKNRNGSFINFQIGYCRFLCM